MQDAINAAKMAYSEYKLYLEEQQRKKADQLQKAVQAEKEEEVKETVAEDERVKSLYLNS